MAHLLNDHESMVFLTASLVESVGDEKPTLMVGRSKRGVNLHVEMRESWRLFVEYLNVPRPLSEVKEWLREQGAKRGSLDRQIAADRVRLLAPGGSYAAVVQAFENLRIITTGRYAVRAQNGALLITVPTEGEPIHIAPSSATMLFDWVDGEELPTVVRQYAETAQKDINEVSRQLLDDAGKLIDAGLAHIGAVDYGVSMDKVSSRHLDTVGIPLSRKAIKVRRKESRRLRRELARAEREANRSARRDPERGPVVAVVQDDLTGPMPRIVPEDFTGPLPRR